MNIVGCGPSWAAADDRDVDAADGFLASPNTRQGERFGERRLEPGPAARVVGQIGEQLEHLPVAARLADERGPGGPHFRPPCRIRDLGFGGNEHPLGGVGVGETPEQSDRTGGGDECPLLVTRGGRPELGEQLLPLDEPAAREQHVGEHASRLETAVGGPGGTGQPLGRRPVEGEVGLTGRHQQQLGRCGPTAVEAPQAPGG